MKTLIAPIHLDAFLLPNDMVVRNALADYSCLPWTDTDNKRQYNSNTPYLGDAIFTKPFGDKNLQLGAGVHLHWALPSGLTKSMGSLAQRNNQPTGVDFPPVPDLWLVRRLRNGQVEHKWLVESAYISLIRGAEQGNISAVTVPFHDDRPDNKTQPYRYMGRQWDGAQLDGEQGWVANQALGDNYLLQITAVGFNPQKGSKGYAEPTFAAFYPNCLSVFGFHDADTVTAPEGLAYEVLGVYADAANDYLATYLDDFKRGHVRTDAYDEKAFCDDLNKALARDFLWQIDPPIAADDDVPGASLLYGKAIPRPSGAPATDHHVQVCVGNTGTEALSAYLASRVQPDDSTKLEELLEAIQFSSRLQNRVLDIGHKFQEARHDKGFLASPGGTLWHIRLETTGAQTAAQKNETEGDRPALPDSVAALLNNANKWQSAYEQAGREMWSLRRQLYADWFRYMISDYLDPNYPGGDVDLDAAVGYIRQQSLAPLQDRLNKMGTIALAKDDSGRLSAAQATGSETTLAGQLAGALTQLLTAVNAANDAPGTDGRSWRDKGQVLAIRPTAAPRFWRPNDPVVLFAEEVKDGRVQTLQNDRQPTQGSADPVTCRVIDSPLADRADWSWAMGLDTFEMVAATFDVKETGQATDGVIWNPFMLEWEVEYTPAIPLSNETDGQRQYAPDAITSHYQLVETGPDLSLTGDPAADQSATLYKGSTLLTPAAGVNLDRAIRQFLDVNKDNQTADTLGKLNQALDVMAQHNVLSQSLGGFHEALLMQKQARQLDVADPLGIGDYKQFTIGEVAPLVGKANRTAPQSQDAFNPIRGGLLNIMTLRLIDSFGQTVDFETPAVKPSMMVSNSRQPNDVWLNPRLAQPARLNFRFLSAADGAQEANAHPASSPVCGWMVPNNLDRSLMFYDAGGRALGALTMNATSPWQPAPDSAAATFIDGIANPYLRRVARHIFDYQKADIVRNNGSTDDSFLAHFLDALDSALENISPENFAAHQDLALLMGRPIAVARAMLSLELNGLPATDQGLFAQEVQGQSRSSAGFTAVKLPIRLGEYRQVNDGLVGYWLETPRGQLGDTYFSSEAGDNPDDDIQTYHDGGQPLNIQLALADAPLTVTLLLDPTGTVHATSGILPVKSIALPTEQYRDALRRIAVTFLTAPVLSPADHLQIDLPNEPGYEWSWFERDNDRQWQEIRKTVLISRALFDQKFPDLKSSDPNKDLWSRLVAKQWLQPAAADPQQATVTTAVRRAFPPDPAEEHPFPEAVGKRLDNFFDVYGRRIEPFDLTLVFDAPQIIREGWLRLGPAPQTEPPAG